MLTTTQNNLHRCMHCHSYEVESPPYRMLTLILNMYKECTLACKLSKDSMIYLVYVLGLFPALYCTDLNVQYTASQHLLCNMHSFMPFSGHTSHFQHSFCPQVVALWNTLPSVLTSAPPLKNYSFLSLFMLFLH